MAQAATSPTGIAELPHGALCGRLARLADMAVSGHRTVIDLMVRRFRSRISTERDLLISAGQAWFRSE
jgi:hypothetical protein